MFKKFLFVTLIISLLAINIFSQMSKKQEITTEKIIYDTERNIQGFLAQPQKTGKYPAIVIIHEWWGLNSYIEERTKNFAELGYIALAVDMYEGKTAQTPDEARALSTESRNNLQKGLDNISKAISYLKGKKNVDSRRIASLGYCFGGGWSYQTAKNNLGTKVSVIYYGTINPKDDLSKMKTVILGNFGEKDQSIKAETVKEFEQVLKGLSKKHEINIYTNAGHAFDNKNGQNYNKEASEKAWKNTVTFLKKYL
ncbi:MAG: dienelactone hydrolase family protein [Spirochaetes bacterium]|nr:dienelactone hydrolase family protein [Spirochaetota bacterium]